MNTGSKAVDINLSGQDGESISKSIKKWAIELGFQDIGITDTDLSEHEKYLQQWLKNKFHGEMAYMEKHGTKRSRPEELLPGTIRIISVRMDYLPPEVELIKTLNNKNKAYIARYALGRDYHKVLKNKLIKLAKKIHENIQPLGYRAFVDSAPVLEKALAEKAGLGWIGKNTLVLNKKAGSYFFLGEIYTDLPLPIDQPVSKHCGSCTACIDICPTQAIIGPYQLDARKCISYLTIEYKGSIPIKFRKLISNRIFGCDDCQIFCPWNKFAKFSQEEDFKPRHNLNNQNLIELFLWDEKTFLEKTEGSAIRRAGYECFIRNLAIALGNAPTSPEIIAVLNKRLYDSSPLIQEHVEWALAQHLS